MGKGEGAREQEGGVGGGRERASEREGERDSAQESGAGDILQPSQITG